MNHFQKCHKFDQVSCAKALISFHSSYNVLSLFLKRRSGLLELFPYGLGGLHVLYFSSVGCWITWFISSWERNNCCHKLNLFTKITQNGHGWTKLSFWVKIVAILWICSALQRVISFSAWDKSRDPTANWRKLKDM